MKLNLEIIRKISEEYYYSQCGFLQEYEDNDNKPLDQTDKESLDIEYDWMLGHFKRYFELINDKRVETTKEQPKYNLKAWTEDLIEEDASINTHIFHLPSEDECRLQFIGVELYLKSDGTYILTDTTGG